MVGKNFAIPFPAATIQEAIDAIRAIQSERGEGCYFLPYGSVTGADDISRKPRSEEHFLSLIRSPYTAYWMSIGRFDFGQELLHMVESVGQTRVNVDLAGGDDEDAVFGIFQDYERHHAASPAPPVTVEPVDGTKNTLWARGRILGAIGAVALVILGVALTVAATQLGWLTPPTTPASVSPTAVLGLGLTSAL